MMKKEKLLKEYPEFEGVDCGFSDGSGIKNVLDKHFIRKEEVENKGWFSKLVFKAYELDEESFNKKYVERQKVKEAIDTVKEDIKLQISSEGIWDFILKEKLGLE